VPDVLRSLIRKPIQIVLERTVSSILANPYVAGKLFPLEENRRFYVVHKGSRARSHDDLPVPPQELWEGYGKTADEYLASGRQDMQSMLSILRRAGAVPEDCARVLELGCAAARMLRYFPHPAGRSELWGVDIKAKHITWCQQHLSPPLLFATTTTAPHLPFEDRYFDLIFCGSVFTHISDLADAWFLELRRILVPGGYAYITIHDKHSVELLLGKYRDRQDYEFLVDILRNLDRETSVLSQDYAAFAVGHEPGVQVFYDIDYLVQKWSRLAEAVSVAPEAYGYQTAIVARK